MLTELNIAETTENAIWIFKKTLLTSAYIRTITTQTS